ncbi:hypothetical protein GDO86_001612, partial [Hymenochirus boettgeri]
RSHGQSINQTQQTQSILQGETMFLECTYQISTSPYLFWYVQYPGEGLQMLINSLAQGEENGFSAKHQKSKTSFHLNKDKAELQDTGVYFCAVSSDTVIQEESPPVI